MKKYLLFALLLLSSSSMCLAQRLELNAGVHYFHAGLGDATGLQNYVEGGVGLHKYLKVVGRFNIAYALSNQFKNGQYENSENLLTRDQWRDNFPIYFPNPDGIYDFGFNKTTPNSDYYVTYFFDLNLQTGFTIKNRIGINGSFGASYSKVHKTYIGAIYPSEIANLYTNGEPIKMTLTIPTLLSFNDFGWNANIGIDYFLTKQLKVGVRAMAYSTSSQTNVSAGGNIGVLIGK